MPVYISKGCFRVAVTLLLVFCLSPSAFAAHWMSGWEESGASPNDLLFTPAFPNSAAFVLAEGTRNRNGGSDNLKAAIVRGQTPRYFARKYFSDFFDSNAGVSHRTDRTAIPIRAPPRPQFGLY